jgi:flagellar motor switch protein FliG
MVAGGARKAALLLMSLDATSAAELLRNAPKAVVTDIAVEMAHIEAAGHGDKTVSVEPAKEFFTLLRKRKAGTSGSAQLTALLEKAVGRDQAGEILKLAQAAVQERDPFLSIRSAGLGDLARILQGESGQVAAMVLGELTSAKASKLLPMLDERVRSEAIRGMTSGDGASLAVRTRVAARLAERLNVGLAVPGGGGDTGAATGDGTEQTQKLRKVAMLLRGLDAPTRDALLKAIDSNDADAGRAVRDLMVIWADVASVADRTLQNILRLVDARNLALALHGAEPALVAKINSNISERARALVDEETSLMSSPKQEDVEKARQEMLQAMRELNATGQLEFEEQA